MLVAGTLAQGSGNLGSISALLDSVRLPLHAFHTSEAGIIVLLHLPSALGGLMD